MKKQKIVIVGPTDYGICDHIIKSLKQSGHDVMFVPEIFRSGIMLLDRIIFRLPIQILSFWLAKFIVWRGKSLNFREPDILLVIRGRYLNVEALNHIDNYFCFKKRIMYQWDSSDSLPIFKDQIDFFDSVLTFDADDALHFGIKHRHLFNFIPKSSDLNNSSTKYSICFIGTLHADRGAKVSEFLKENNRFKDSAFISLYIPFMTYLWHKVIRSSLVSGVRWKDLTFFQIHPSENLRILSMSSMILDIAQPDQSGFTLRTFEALGLRKKLVTTNEEIYSEDFYHPNNICVVSRNDWSVSKTFENTPYTDLENDIIQKYSVEGWLRDVLNL